MKLKLFVLATALTLSFSSAFAADADQTNTNNTQTQSAEEKKDQNADILGWLVVLNKNEIEGSTEVLKHKGLHADVAEYAAMLKKDHSAGLKQTLKVSHEMKEEPSKSTASVALKMKGQKELVALKALSLEQMQKSFIDNMVNDHEMAIKKVNEDLKEVSNPELKTLLKDTLAHLEVHLEKAKAIQEKMKSNA